MTRAGVRLNVGGAWAEAELGAGAGTRAGFRLSVGGD